MRKEKKEQKRIAVNGIQGYHARENYADNYAQAGFNGGFKVFASDRTRPADGSAKSYGLEIELCSSINSSVALGIILEKVVFPTFPAGLFKQQRDGSLCGNSSSEVITQPMTKAFIRNHYNDFKAMWLFLKDINTAPNNSCGMHTNISMVCFGKTETEQKKAIMRLHNYFCDNYTTACALLKRDTAHTTYCGRMNRDYLDPCGSHYYMMNYSHMNEGASGRVEIRLVGPQKSFGAFRNTMEVIFHLVESAKEGRDFTDPLKLWEGCNECVIDRLRDIVGNGLDAEQFTIIKDHSVNKGIMNATR